MKLVPKELIPALLAGAEMQKEVMRKKKGWTYDEAVEYLRDYKGAPVASEEDGNKITVTYGGWPLAHFADDIWYLSESEVVFELSKSRPRVEKLKEEYENELRRYKDLIRRRCQIYQSEKLAELTIEYNGVLPDKKTLPSPGYCRNGAASRLPLHPFSY